ncbi:MAG TPA: vWA domain-containing protein [Pirellulaceae bacterium]|nr:vWA domain-containing protein [Pirellulaceae bacterium]
MFGLVAQASSTSTRIEWRNLPESWQAFVAVGVVFAVAAYVVWSYRRESDSVPRWVRWTLVTLRLAVIGLLILLLFDPVRTDYRTLRRYPTVAVMSDLSQSMTTKDGWLTDDVASSVAASLGMNLEQFREAGLDRMAVLRKLMTGERSLPELLRDKANVRVLTFGSQVDTVTTLPSNAEQDSFASDGAGEAEAEANSEDGAGGASPTDPLAEAVVRWEASGTSSDLSGALQTALDISQLRAIYLFSDGQHTGASQPVEIARRAAEMGIPIYGFGIGDPSRPRNVSVRDVSVLAKVRPNEPFAVDTMIAASEMAGTTVRVELYRTPIAANGTEGDPELVEGREVTITDPAWLSRERFGQRIGSAGRFRYEVRIEGVEGETETADNLAESTPLEVTNERIKVLLISGTPTWEYQNLRKLFERDPGITLSCWLQSLAPQRPQEGNERIVTLPRTFEQLAQYNAILLIDPNPDEFDEGMMQALERFVERKAGGLMYMAGQKYSSDFLNLPRLETFRKLLPVRLEGAGEATLSTLLQVSSGIPAVEAVDANLDHPVMTFSAERADNVRVWAAMPGTYWSFPAIGAKPTAKTLLEHQDATLSLDGDNRRPLLVAGRYGAGNTLYVGFPGTWRWRSVGVQAEYYDRFWIQAISFLTDTRSIQGLKRGTVDPDRETYELGDRVELTARLLGPTFDPLVLPEVNGVLKDGNGTEVPLVFRAIEGQPGLYLTTWRARGVGRYEASVTLPDVTDASLLEGAQFRVEAPSAEARATWLNEPLLREICEASGGAYYRLDEFPRAVAELSTSYESVEWREPPKPIWDLSSAGRFLMFALPILLLAIEWSIRKWFKLL